MPTGGLTRRNAVVPGSEIFNPVSLDSPFFAVLAKALGERNTENGPSLLFIDESVGVL